ncbi:hypothetical protein SMMN14_05031 [Sphaerulina musiva]
MSSTPTTKEEEKDSLRSTNTTGPSNSKRSTGVRVPVKKKEMKKKRSIVVPAAFNSVVESILMSEQQRQARAQCTATATQTYRVAVPTAAPGREKDDIEKEEAEQELREEQEEYTMIHKSTIPAPGALETMGKAYASEVFPGDK